MNIHQRSKILRNWSPTIKAGFTLVEMLVSSGIFMMVIMAMVYAHLFGLRQNQLVESKTGASDEARKSLANMVRDVRTAKYHTIGNWNSGTFNSLPNGVNQVGNAIQLNLTTNFNIGITYYFDTNTAGNWKLYRIRTGDAAPTVIASHLTNNFGNSLVFQAEDYTGTVITDVSNRRMIHFLLGFSEFQYPRTKLGAGKLYDRYKLEFKLTPHVPEGR